MDPKRRQQASERQKALDQIPDEDLAKVESYQASVNGALPVDEEWLLLAEFAMKFGWEAYKEVREDRISTSEMLTLVSASRKLDYKRMYDNAQTSFIGAGSAGSKKPGTTFKKLTKDILKNLRL